MSKRKSKSKSKKPEPEAPAPEERKSSSASWIFVAFALVGVATFALVLLGTDEPPRPELPPPVHPVDAWRARPVQDVGFDAGRDYARGPVDPAVTIVTFSDFECNHCRDANIELKRIYQSHPDDVQIVFKNYPLDMSCNENMTRPNFLHSCKAAVMARCAGEQDRFWEMHDAIYALPRLSMSALDALPEEVGVAGAAYDACVANETPMSDIQADIDLGKSLGVTGTPSVFINGRKMPSFRAQTVEVIVDHLASGADR
jgi:protein-disulfide isomerase